MARDLGSMAQAKLDEWAAQVSITANPSTKDKEGWDFILQLPYSPANFEIPLDLRPPRIECWIQVKGVGTKRKRESITLSNWEKLVSSPLPAFFLIIHYSKENTPRNAFLVHVDQRWIEKVLRRLRKVPQGKKSQLNKLTLDLTWSEDDGLDSLDGKGLEACICKHIGDDFSSYIEKKQKIRKEIGQDSPHSLHITSTPYSSSEDLITDWVDFAIGVRDSIPVAKGIIEKDVRFGIPAERVEREGGILSIVDRAKTGQPVKLIIRNETNTQRSIFPSLLFTPDHLFPNEPVPEDLRKVRIASEIGDFIVRPHSGTTLSTQVKLLIKADDKPRNLSELANLWRVVNILQSASPGSCIIEVCIDEENAPVEIGNIKIDVEFSKDHLFIAQAVANAWHLSKLFDLPAGMELTLDQILDQHHVLAQVRGVHDFNYPVNAIKGQIISDDLPLDKEYATLFSRILRFDTISVFVIIGFAGKLTILTEIDVEEKSFEIVKPRRIFFEYNHLSNQEDQYLNNLLDLALEKIEEKGYEVIQTHN